MSDPSNSHAGQRGQHVLSGGAGLGGRPQRGTTASNEFSWE
jgi:hypothetical protein